VSEDVYEGYLFCPSCDKQHTDTEVGGHAVEPHEEHRCLYCGFVWRVSPPTWGVGVPPNPRMPCDWSSYGRVRLLDGLEASTTTVWSVMMQLDELLQHNHQQTFLDLVFTARGMKPKVAGSTLAFCSNYYRLVLPDGSILEQVKRTINCAVVDDGNGGLKFQWPLMPVTQGGE
jgi:hypothetical protein